MNICLSDPGREENEALKHCLVWFEKQISGQKSEKRSVDPALQFGPVHALENLGKIALELIEIQSGSCLGEYNIVRFEDCYDRL